MKKNKRKAYEKPKITKINLDAQCAVLGFCKSTSHIGPGSANCGLGFRHCMCHGS
ncbi:MAG: hypothetical protein ACMUJM_03755 [bacterium]